MIHHLASADDLPALLTERAVIGFFGSFSALSEQARPGFEAFAASCKGTVVFVDVGQVKGVHKLYDVTSVPAAVMVEDGRVIRRASGMHDAEGWRRALVPHESAYAAFGTEDGPRQPPVTVYTSPTCVWCGRIKDYLTDNSITFREIDISRDQDAAQELVKRSGQMGVPQTDVGGQIVVGFDRPKLDRLLGLQA